MANAAGMRIESKTAADHARIAQIFAIDPAIVTLRQDVIGSPLAMQGEIGLSSKRRMRADLLTKSRHTPDENLVKLAPVVPSAGVTMTLDPANGHRRILSGKSLPCYTSGCASADGSSITQFGPWQIMNP